MKKLFFWKTTDTDDDDNDGGKKKGLKCKTIININEMNNCKKTRKAKAKVSLCSAHA